MPGGHSQKCKWNVSGSKNQSNSLEEDPEAIETEQILPEEPYGAVSGLNCDDAPHKGTTLLSYALRREKILKKKKTGIEMYWSWVKYRFRVIPSEMLRMWHSPLMHVPLK
ncbi:hypothetical protein GGU11DRAFT_750483 [Lentinula aff. detonsa]|nr:hypothetical protein GGU11DRAFT_750483 [Lentinula aff. detonsa]